MHAEPFFQIHYIRLALGSWLYKAHDAYHLNVVILVLVNILVYLQHK